MLAASFPRLHTHSEHLMSLLHVTGYWLSLHSGHPHIPPVTPAGPAGANRKRRQRYVCGCVRIDALPLGVAILQCTGRGRQGPASGKIHSNEPAICSHAAMQLQRDGPAKRRAAAPRSRTGATPAAACAAATHERPMEAGLPGHHAWAAGPAYAPRASLRLRAGGKGPGAGGRRGIGDRGHSEN